MSVETTAGLVGGLIPFALGLLVGLPLVWHGRRQPGVLSAIGVFAVISALLALVEFLPQMLGLVGLPTKQDWFLTVHLPSLLADVALGTLVLIAYAVVTRHVTPRMLRLLARVCGLNIGLGLIALLYLLYDRAITASQASAGQASAGQQLSWAEALIVVVALGWDLLMSGEQITNRHDRAFPRSVRLLLYLGYLMFVATAVVYFSAQSLAVTAQHVETAFESEPWPQQGLVTLGLPMLFTAFMLEVSRLRAEPSSSTSTGQEPQAVKHTPAA